jgi:hypothetical protein
VRSSSGIGAESTAFRLRYDRAMATAKTKKRETKAKPARKPAPRADYGAPIDGFLAKRPPVQRKVLEELRALIHAAAPDATEMIKWGMPFYSLDGNNLCSTPAFKAHIQVVFFAPSASLVDPDGLLDGESANGRHLKIPDGADWPRAAVKKWLAVAAKHARA